MRSVTVVISRGVFVAICIIAVLMVPSTRASAQNKQGQNAVYDNSQSGAVVGSSAFIDASMFVGNVIHPNFCTVLVYVLNPQNGVLTSIGAVIDARGLPGSTGTSMTCTSSPWSGITNPPPSTILLPAGTITISNTWVLPNGTRVIGEGSSSSSTVQTTIQACNTPNCFHGPPNEPTLPMIQFGDGNCPTPACSGVTLEDLNLNGNGVSNSQLLDGVDNSYSRDPIDLT